MSDVSVRLAWPDDAAALARIQVATWLTDDRLPAGVEPPDPAAHAERWRATLTRSPQAGFRVLVALERARICGFAVVHPAVDPDADPISDGELGELAIDPDHRGSGHGSRLAAAAVETLAADGAHRVVWWVGSTDDRLRAFAMSCGWSPDGAHRTLAGPDGTEIRQVRLQTAPA